MARDFSYRVSPSRGGARFSHIGLALPDLMPNRYRPNLKIRYCAGVAPTRGQETVGGIHIMA